MSGSLRFMKPSQSNFLTVEFYTAREDDPYIKSGGEHLSLPFIYPPADFLTPANEFFPVSLKPISLLYSIYVEPALGDPLD